MITGTVRHTEMKMLVARAGCHMSHLAAETPPYNCSTARIKDEDGIV